MQKVQVSAPACCEVVAVKHQPVAALKTIGAFVFAVLAPCAAQAQSPSAYLERLNSEALPQWVQYKQYANKITGTIKAGGRTKGRGDNEDYSAWEYHVRQNPRSALLQIDQTVRDADDTRPVSKVFGCNSRYSFQVDRRTRDSDWLVQSYIPDDRDGTTVTNEKKPIRDVIFEMVGPQFMVYNIPLPSIVSDPRWSVTGMTDESRNGKHIVRLTFEFDNPIDDKTFTTPLQGGSLLLDPKHDWCIREATLRLKWINGEGLADSRLDFKAGSGGHLLPTQFMRSRKLNASETYVVTRDFDLRDNDDSIPDTAFTLSAFGLPEPVGVIWEKPAARYIWFLVAGGASAIVAFALFYFKNRLNRARS